MPLRLHTFDLNNMEKIISVKNASQLKDAIDIAKEGYLIELENGNYDFHEFPIKCQGEQGKPIVIRARQPGHNAVIRHDTSAVENQEDQEKPTLIISGKWVYIEGLRFVKSSIQLQHDGQQHDGQSGGQCRITRCLFEDGNRSDGVIELISSLENRIDYCEFRNARGRG